MAADKKDRNYSTPCCPNCGEECMVCCNEKCYVDDMGEWITEEENE